MMQVRRALKDKMASYSNGIVSKKKQQKKKAWTTEEESTLVEMWVQRPVLFEAGSKNYSNRIKRGQALPRHCGCNRSWWLLDFIECCVGLVGLLQ